MRGESFRARVFDNRGRADKKKKKRSIAVASQRIEYASLISFHAAWLRRFSYSADTRATFFFSLSLSPRLRSRDRRRREGCAFSRERKPGGNAAVRRRGDRTCDCNYRRLSRRSLLAAGVDERTEETETETEHLPPRLFVHTTRNQTPRRETDETRARFALLRSRALTEPVIIEI